MQVEINRTRITCKATLNLFWCDGSVECWPKCRGRVSVTYWRSFLPHSQLRRGGGKESGPAMLPLRCFSHATWRQGECGNAGSDRRSPVDRSWAGKRKNLISKFMMEIMFGEPLQGKTKEKILKYNLEEKPIGIKYCLEWKDSYE